MFLCSSWERISPKITAAVTVLRFGWSRLITIAVTISASAVKPSFPLIPNYHLESHLNYFCRITVTVTVLKCFWIGKVIISNMMVADCWLSPSGSPPSLEAPKSGGSGNTQVTTLECTKIARLSASAIANYSAPPGPVKVRLNLVEIPWNHVLRRVPAVPWQGLKGNKIGWSPVKPVRPHVRPTPSRHRLLLQEIPPCDCISLCDPRDHLQECLGHPGPKSQKRFQRESFWGVCKKSPRKYPIFF